MQLEKLEESPVWGDAEQVKIQLRDSKTCLSSGLLRKSSSHAECMFGRKRETQSCAFVKVVFAK